MIESINWLSELLDTGISLLGKYGRWLNAKQKRICFILWNICTGYWVFRNLSLGLYSQTFFCFVSIALNTYAFFFWGKKAEQKKTETHLKGENIHKTENIAISLSGTAHTGSNELKFQWIDTWNGDESYLSINGEPILYKLITLVENGETRIKYFCGKALLMDSGRKEEITSTYQYNIPSEMESAKKYVENSITDNENIRSNGKEK